MTALPQLLEQGQLLAISLQKALVGAAESEAPNTISDYLRSCHRDDTRIYSNEIPGAQMAIYKRISEEDSPAIAGLCNQLALVKLSIERLQSEQFVTLPQPIQQLTRNWFGQIYADLATRDPQDYDLQQEQGPRLDDLKRDFAVCTGRAIPAGGAWVVEKRRLVGEKLFSNSGLSSDSKARPAGQAMYRALKRTADNAGILAPMSSLRSHWYQLKGRYADYLVIHTADRYRRYFSEKYLDEAYRNIALLLRQDTNLQGLYRSSWFLDPKVIEIEPKLVFLSNTPVQHGALHGPLKRLEDTELAKVLKHSNRRASAYEQGDYEPWSWAYLWLSKDLLNWAEHQAEGN